MRRSSIVTPLLVAAASLLAPAPAGAAGFQFLLSWGSAGHARGALDGPDNVAVDLRGTVYVADRDNNRIEEFSSTGTFLRALGRNGGDGTAGRGNGEFDHPRGVAVDGSGNLYVADSRNNRIEKFGPSGAFIARFGRNGGDGSAGRARGEFTDPRGLATDRVGNLYVADHANNRVQKLSPAGRFLQIWGRDGGNGRRGRGNAQFNLPRGVAVNRAGDLYVADKGNHRVQEFAPDGTFVRRWGRNGGNGSRGAGNGEFNTPYSVAVDRAGHVYVADTVNNRIQTFTGAGAFLSRFGAAGGSGAPGTGPGEFRTPYGVATDCRSNLYVTDEGNNRIEKFGDPVGAAPICPPALTLRPVPRRIPGRVLRILAACDEPCSVAAVGTVTLGADVIGRFRATRRGVSPVRAVALKLRLGTGAARALHRSLRAGGHPVVHLEVSATGFAGRSKLVRRVRQLRP